MRTKSLKKNKINVITLGCSKNTYDSEVLMGQLKANGKEVAHEEEGNIGSHSYLFVVIAVVVAVAAVVCVFAQSIQQSYFLLLCKGVTNPFNT